MAALQKLNYSHEALVDLIIASPAITQNELAVHFGYTPAWISTIMSSDAFKERLAARRTEIINPALVATVEERMESVALKSLEVLQEKLSQPASAIPDQLALQAAALGARGLGKGGFGGTSSQTNIQVNVEASERLGRIRDRLTSLVSEARGVTDVETILPKGTQGA